MNSDCGLGFVPYSLYIFTYHPLIDFDVQFTHMCLPLIGLALCILILIFDNGAFRHRESFQYSRGLEVARDTKKIVWQWTDPSKELFYTTFMGGAQRLSSGHTLFTESAFGRIVEIDDEGDVCWEYYNPHFAVYEEPHVREVFPGESNALFRSYKYTPEETPWLNAGQPHREVVVVVVDDDDDGGRGASTMS